MPYVITAFVEPDRSLRGQVESRRAVATLEGRAVWNALYGVDLTKHREEVVDRITTLPESGGTVGPLPDGTVIEVERVEWSQLRFMVSGRIGMAHDNVIDAFNAREVRS